VPTLPDLAASVDPHFDQLFATGNVPAIAYGVINGGELIHSRGLGSIDLDGADSPPDVDTLFRIASMTKSFTAATLLSLRDDGQLGLDDHLVDFVPEMRRGGPANHEITLRQLLTMAAGFPTDDPWGDRQQDLDPDDFASLLATPLEPMWRPGDRFEYSNLGYALLGRVIESVTGKRYRDVVKARVLSPMSLTSTGFDLADLDGSRLATGYVRREDQWVVEPPAGYGAFAPMGGLLSSVSDLRRWVAAMLDAQLLDSSRGSAGDSQTNERPKATSLREMQTGQRFVEAVSSPTLDSPLRPPTVVHYGFGLFEEISASGRTISHSGGYPGFGSHMRWHLRSGLGIVALGNRSYAPMGKVSSAALEAAIATVGDSDQIDTGQQARLREAQQVVERLTNDWDESLVAEWFTDNVDQDEPWPVRRRHLERLQATHGRLASDPQFVPEDLGPAQAVWWLRGERGGRVKVEILLSPHPTPRIQSVSWLSVPEPAAAVVDLARQALTASDPEAVLGEATAGGGVTSATFAAQGERGKLEVVVDAAGQTKVRPVPLHTRP
jgi:CubicO group peptidase (beta-lactamase class C family)